MNRRTTVTALSAALALAGTLALGGCAGDKPDEPALKVSGAYMPQPVNNEMAGGFLTLRNDGAAADELVSVTGDISGDISIHETVDQKMRPVKSLDIPAKGELKLERGGNHLMFMGLKRTLKQGDTVSVKLRFAKSEPIEVKLPVEAPNHDPAHH
ncbi:copper chaperone PCu(A)C [Streptomyces sp. LP05-1]|uniref:Copper chaperone PCu(A)C n=1 Tax=Streptomyces pyxinae TaxID=2970734 RepID=A0ABT2CCJ2_9ACTN|nr:copper chaperone PCu(A)C [Streptomyces sp. LP05-1]MCS0635133.1 copper chaperone PCu(A)C [Streptomyces sp. LP05-1]